MRMFEHLSEDDLNKAIKTARAVIDPCSSETAFLEVLEEEVQAREIARRVNQMTAGLKSDAEVSVA